MVRKFKKALKRTFIPVTILVVPHSRKKPMKVKIPLAGIMVIILLACIGTGWVLSIGVNAFEYHSMKRRVTYFSSQFIELRSTINYLKKSEDEFKRLLAFKTKKDMINAVGDGEIDGLGNIEELKKQTQHTAETVAEIRNYLKRQKDAYRATPMGAPVSGSITSYFGMREHPKWGEPAFHGGIDISSSTGMPVYATADGVVVFSGRHAGTGNLVVIEHGFGFNTAYGHNKELKVSVGQEVKRGDVIALSGVSGTTTGPHVHYEVWRHGKRINPLQYIKGDSYVWEKTARN